MYGYFYTWPSFALSVVISTNTRSTKSTIGSMRNPMRMTVMNREITIAMKMMIWKLSALFAFPLTSSSSSSARTKNSIGPRNEATSADACASRNETCEPKGCGDPVTAPPISVR